jgi:hypothetical protein
MPAAIEARYAQGWQVVRLLQDTQRSFMMVLKELGCDYRYRENLSAAERRSAVIRVVHDFQHVIHDHITRYIVAGVHVVLPSDGRLSTSILTRSA